jgi:hypothetical protein
MTTREFSHFRLNLVCRSDSTSPRLNGEVKEEPRDYHGLPPGFPPYYLHPGKNFMLHPPPGFPPYYLDPGKNFKLPPPPGFPPYYLHPGNTSIS